MIKSDENKLQQAKTAIDVDRKARAEQAKVEIDAALKRTRCTIEVGILVTPRGNRPVVEIVPID